MKNPIVTLEQTLRQSFGPKIEKEPQNPITSQQQELQSEHPNQQST